VLNASETIQIQPNSTRPQLNNINAFCQRFSGSLEVGRPSL